MSVGSIARIATRPSLWLRLPRFVTQLRFYRRMEQESPRRLPLRMYPCLEDNTPAQTNFGFYFYQDSWAARQVFREKPPSMVDVGSTVLLVGILSQFTPCVSVDIRPLQAKLGGLSAVAGSVLNLPFADGEVHCLTTMCVLEHIGLGRYGDPLSPTGTEDAAREIARAIAPGGVVIYSLPVANDSVLEFNANRRFTCPEAAELFAGWTVIDSCLLVPHPVPYTPIIPQGASDVVACFCCRKPGDRRESRNASAG